MGSPEDGEIGFLSGESDQAVNAAQVGNPVVPEQLAVDDRTMAPRENAEILIPGPYFVIGLDPKADSLERHAYRPVDLYRWMHALMKDPARVRIVIADIGLQLNIHTRLKKKPQYADTPDQELRLQAQNTARLIGIKELLFIEAMQDYILRIQGEPSPMYRDIDEGDWRDPLFDIEAFLNRSRNQGHHFSAKPVHLMSEFFDSDYKNVSFAVTYVALSDIISRDTALAKMFLECVPDIIVKKAIQENKKAVEGELEEGRVPIRPEIMELFKYTITQVAVTLLSGTKYGHEGEKVYDELTTYIFEHYWQRLGMRQQDRPQFVYPEVEMDGSRPYRWIPTEVVRHDTVFSIDRTFDEETLRGPLDVSASVLGRNVSYEEIHFQGLELVPIYERFFELIERSNALTPQEKIEIRNAEIRKLMKEALIAISRTPEGQTAVQAARLQEMDLSTLPAITIIMQMVLALRDENPSINYYDPIRDLSQFFIRHLNGGNRL